MEKAFYLLLILFFSSGLYGQNIELRSKMTIDKQVSNIWGYTAEGREYALVGAYSGLTIVDVTNPDVPQQIVHLPHNESSWKDVKTYRHYAYTIAGLLAGQDTALGISIVDLSKLPSPDLESHFYTGDGLALAKLTQGATLHIDQEKGFLYLFGTPMSGMVVCDLNEDPYHPKFVANYPQLGYHLDAFVSNDTLYGANSSQFTIIDMHDKSNPVILNTQPSTGFAHSTWLSDDRKVMFTVEEWSGSSLTAYDISDIDDIKLLDNVQATPGSRSTLHYAYINGDHAVTAWYTDGVAIINTSRPNNMVVVGKYDTAPQSNGLGNEGCWGVYPYFPSGNIIAGSNLYQPLSGELYVLTPSYALPSYLEGTITDSESGNPVSGARLEILDYTDALTNSDYIGRYSTGLIGSGTYTVKVSKLYYEPFSITVQLAAGDVTNLDIALIPVKYSTVKGVVVDEVSGAPVGGVKINLISKDYPFSIITNPDGQFEIASVVNGDYGIFMGKWGYNYSAPDDISISGEPTLIFKIRPGYEDHFVQGYTYPWTANAVSSGKWLLTEPYGLNYMDQPVMVEHDIQDDIDSLCMVTGGYIDYYTYGQVDQNSILTSPVMDLSGYVNPKVSAKIWAYSFNIWDQHRDSIKVYIKSKGIEKLAWAARADLPEWQTISFNVSDFVPAGDSVTVRIMAKAQPQDLIWDSFRAAFDDFEVYDQAVATSEPLSGALISAQPNPFGQSTIIHYDGLKQYSHLRIFDLLGRLVESQEITSSSGQISVGEHLNDGVYFVRLEQSGAVTNTIKILKTK